MKSIFHHLHLEYTLEGHSHGIEYLVTYKDKLISCSDDETIKIWNLNLKDNLNENVETYNTCIDDLILCNGYLYGCYGNKIKIFKYQPYFEDYQKAVLTVFKIMNSKRILFRKKLYKGKFFLKEVNKVMEMYDTFSTNIITIANTNNICTNNIITTNNITSS